MEPNVCLVHIAGGDFGAIIGQNPSDFSKSNRIRVVILWLRFLNFGVHSIDSSQTVGNFPRKS